MPSRLERYLDDVSQPVSHTVRPAWREEARQHIEAMATAYEEMGHTADEATALALEKFGEARSVGERVQAETGSRTTNSAAIATFLWPVSLCFITLGAFSVVYALHVAGGAGGAGGEAALRALVRAGQALQIAAPVLGGWWMARRLRGRLSLRRMLSALAVAVPSSFLMIAAFVSVSQAFRAPLLGEVLGQMPVWFALSAVAACLPPFRAPRTS